eukprot:scaffold3267_cov140-Cylindrotheca_fusiformis.AAC.12
MTINVAMANVLKEIGKSQQMSDADRIMYKATGEYSIYSYSGARRWKRVGHKKRFRILAPPMPYWRNGP